MIRRMFLTALVAGASLFAAAYAQEDLKIFHFNRQQILQESRALADAETKLQSILQTLETELKAQEEKAQAAEDEFTAQQAVVSEEKAQELAQGLLEQRIELLTSQQAAQTEIEQARQSALGAIDASMRTILNSLAAERDADFIFERSAVFYGDPRFDLTDVVLQRLNASTPSVNVERTPLTETQRERIRANIVQQIAAAQAQRGPAPQSN